MPEQIRRTDGSRTQPACPVELSPPGSTSEVDNEELNHDPKTSGATKEAAASKALEHGLEGRAQEARLRAMQQPTTVMVNGQPVASPTKEDPPRMYKMVDGEGVLVRSKDEKASDVMSKSEQSGTVTINDKGAFRIDDRSTHCNDGKDTTKSSEDVNLGID